MNDIIPIEKITGLIYLIRGKKVMLDRDLAQLYGVETKVFKQAVRRNIERFPEDFMFELSKSEFINWRSQFVTSSRDKMGLRYKPNGIYRTRCGHALRSLAQQNRYPCKYPNYAGLHKDAANDIR